MTIAAAFIPARVSDPFQRNTRKFRLMSRLFTADDVRPTREQFDEFVPYLLMGDPQADAVTAWFNGDEGKRLEGRKLFHTILTQGRDAVSEIPPVLRAFFDHVERVPLWLDRGRLALASDTMRRTGGFAELVLRNAALMGSYMAASATKPLMFTGRLANRQNTARRLVETSTFWVHVTRPGGLERFGEGFITTVRVRMMHAQVRYMLVKSGTWDARSWGHPINQADMLATNLLFSQLFLLALQSLGFRFTQTERENVMHFWRYTGYLMGVDERILPTGEADAWRLSYMQYATQDLPDDDSRMLVQALNNIPLDKAGDNRFLQWAAKREIGYRAAFTRLLFGNRLADDLGLKMSPMVVAVLGTAPVVFGLETLRRMTPGATKLAAKLGGWYYERQLARELAATGGKAEYQAVKQLAR